MDEQWYNKSALIKDLTSITGRKMHSNSLNPVFKTPPVLSINEDQDINEMNLRFGIDFEPRDDKKDTDSAMFNFIPDMLNMMRDYEETSSCKEQPLEKGAQKIVISKLNPNSHEFVPRTSPMVDQKNDGEIASPVENNNMLPKSFNISKKRELNAIPKPKCEINEVPEENGKHGDRKKKRCVLNVALTNLSKLHQISKEITRKAAETAPPEAAPLKLLSPDYYMNNKHVETTPEVNEVKEDKAAQNMVKTSIEKVNNWLNVQQEESSASSTPKVRSINNSPKPPAGPFDPIIYKKKVVASPNKECTVLSPRITPTIVRTKKFVPTQTSEDYYNTFCERNERKALASNNLWDRVEAELRKREEKNRREAPAETSPPTIQSG